MVETTQQNVNNHFLPLISIAALTAAAVLMMQGCSGGTDPVYFAIPEGSYHRIESIAPQRELPTWLNVRPDSASIYDTVFSGSGSTKAVDSTHSTQLELNPSGDGYYRAVEEHRIDGSDLVDLRLRYWYFFEKHDSLYFLRGMRLRGNGKSIVGSWRLSSADAKFLNETYTYLFDEQTLTVTRTTGSNAPVVITSPYATHERTLEVENPAVPYFGDRYEVVPGLALYLTSHADKGYQRVSE